MKNILTALLVFSFSVSFSQKSVCESKENTITDLNDLGSNKCDIQTKTTKRELAKKKTKVIVRKRMKKQLTSFNKLRKTTSKTSKRNSLKSDITNTLTKPKFKDILFNLVEEAPLFKACENTNNSESKKCFKNNLNKYISKNFNLESYVETGFKDKLLVKFSINVYGNVENITIIGKTNNKKLYKALKERVEELPNFTPGKQKGIPVNVTYSFPLNLTLN